MKDDRSPVSTSTRRRFLTTTTALATTTLGTTQSVAKASGNKTKYEIGLPLNKRWTTRFADSAGSESPKVNPGTITDDVMYLKVEPTNYDPAKIVAYDVQADTEIWETTASEYVSAPAVIDNTLLVSVVSHLKAYPASEESTSTLWEYESDMDIVSWPIKMRDKFVVPEYNAKPRAGGDSDYTYSDGRLSLYDPDGTRQWSVNGDHIERPFLYGDSIIHYEGRQYKTDGEYHITSGRVVSRDFETGRKQWESSDFNIWGTRPTSTNIILAHSQNEAVRGINTKTRKVDWKVEIGPGVEDYAAGPDCTYIGVKNNLQAVDHATGEAVWSRTDLMPCDVSYDGGLVYVGAYGGNFYALDAETGDTVWEASHPSGDGFMRYDDGKLYTFSRNWASAYIGKQGKALSALEDARSTAGLGTISSGVADFLGRDQALSRAEMAIENRQYDRAMSAIDSANLRKGAVEVAATLVAGGTAYGGARTVGKRVQQHRLESALENTNELYPLQSGALNGLVPEKLIQQGGVAQDSPSQSQWGPSLSDLTTRTDDYGELIDTLSRINRYHPDLVKLSNRLQKHKKDIDIQPWKKLFEKHLNGELDGIDETLNQCRQAISLTDDYASVQQSLPNDTFDLSSLAPLMDAVQSPVTDEHPSVRYIEAALSVLDAYATVHSELAHYDLSSVRNHLQNGLDTDSSRYSSAREDFGDLTKLLTFAKQSENDRTNIDYSHSNLTPAEVQQWIHSALQTLSLNEMKEIRSIVRNLKRGVWKTEHLHAYSPHEFEHLIADLYSDLGYRTQVTQEGSDGGVDVIADGGSESLVIQVKQYSPGNKIGRPTIQQTAGVREQLDANKAVVITSSSFTGTAREASRDYGRRMELVNEQTLKKMLSASSLVPPVRTQAGSQRRRQRQQQREYYQRSQSRNRRGQTTGHRQGSGMFCMVCGNHFQSELETVETLDGETIRCCPRCKQLIEEATGKQDYGHKEALEVLGLDPGASDDEIRQAYRSLVTEVHPDQGGSLEEFRKVQKAYKSLQ